MAKYQFTPKEPSVTPELIAILALDVPQIGPLLTCHRDTQLHTPCPYAPPFNPPPAS